MLEAKILNEYRNVAVVGLSTNPERASYRVASYLSEHGYNIIPVNPKAPQIKHWKRQLVSGPRLLSTGLRAGRKRWNK
jgi:predicted CoA-binding protein